MRRTTAAAEDHAETPSALIDRLSAEYDSEPVADLGDGHDDSGHDDDGHDEVLDGPAAEGASTGRHRRDASANTVDTAATVVTTAASRHAATGAVPRHAAPAGRSTVRRLAPLGVGAAVMLVATLAIALVPQATPASGPDLNSQLAAAPIGPASPTTGGYLDAAGTSTAAPGSTTVATPAPPTSARTGTPPPKSKPVTKPAPKPAPAPRAGTNGDGSQAADKLGWQQVGGDEFNGSGLSGNWGPYEGEGHAGNGRRVASAISVGGGMMTMRGDSAGNSGGMAWNGNQTYGKWEVRARVPKGDDGYHPVLLLWPQDGWPPEIDFFETSAAADGTSFFLHFDPGNQQVSASKQLDITQWHNYAVEWVAGRVTGFIDGVKWFESTDGQTIPNQPMHLAIQLDNFGGSGMAASEMDVDYVRIYK